MITALLIFIGAATAAQMYRVRTLYLAKDKCTNLEPFTEFVSSVRARPHALARSLVARSAHTRCSLYIF